MLPEAGAFELVFLAMVALIVVGPKDLPVLLRKLGQFTAKMRGLAAEFRSSFDEMARQSELDDLRKEVEALRDGRSFSTHEPASTPHAEFAGTSDFSAPSPWSAEAHVSELAGAGSGFGSHDAPDGAPEPGEPVLPFPSGAQDEPELPFDTAPPPAAPPEPGPAAAAAPAPSRAVH